MTRAALGALTWSAIALSEVNFIIINKLYFVIYDKIIPFVLIVFDLAIEIKTNEKPHKNQCLGNEFGSLFY
jgi:hypothetical protein